MKFSVGDVHKNVLSDFEFRENWRIEICNLLKRVRNFHPYFLHFLSDLSAIR